MAIVVMIVGLVMMTSFGQAGPRLGSLLGPFKIAWVAITLLGAGLAFYNAFSDRGISLYEVDADGEGQVGFCPQCGKAVGEHDRFCRHCSATLKE
jgi:hypothetical protein